jgi:proteasome beta subunit
MGTIAAIETTGGVAIAGDTMATDGETVTSERACRVFDLGSAGAGAVGKTGGVREFGRHLESEVDAYELEHGGEVGVETLGRIAARQSDQFDVEAVVATRDGDGHARLRRVDAVGGVMSNPTVALGSGAAVALGRLETADSDLGIDETAAAVEDAIRAATERDTETGGTIDSWTLASDSADGSQEEKPR